MKQFLAIVIAVVLAYFVVSFLGWLVWNLWWLTVNFAKLILVAIVALPLYVLVRRWLLS